MSTVTHSLAGTTTVKVDRYEVRHANGAELVAFRDGQVWRDLSGDKLVLALVQEIERLHGLLNEPELHNFSEAVVLEAAHQRERWGSEHDAGKGPSDWFWLLGYLGGKALASHNSGDTEKALHHTITAAAMCANWHASIAGTNTTMRPGSAEKAEPVQDADVTESPVAECHASPNGKHEEDCNDEGHTKSPGWCAWCAEQITPPPPSDAAQQEVDCVGDTEFESYYAQKGYALSHTGSVGEKQRAREAYWHGYLEAQATNQEGMPDCRAFVTAFAASLDADFGFWSSPTAMPVRQKLYSLWAKANAEIVFNPAPKKET